MKKSAILCFSLLFMIAGCVKRPITTALPDKTNLTPTQGVAACPCPPKTVKTGRYTLMKIDNLAPQQTPDPTKTTQWLKQQ